MQACEHLGLDTRTVCRVTSEKPVQALLSRLDPALRFARNYEALRPHGPHCEESIHRIDLDALMGIALDEARASLDAGDKGVRRGVRPRRPGDRKSP